MDEKEFPSANIKDEEGSKEGRGDRLLEGILNLIHGRLFCDEDRDCGGNRNWMGEGRDEFFNFIINYLRSEGLIDCVSGYRNEFHRSDDRHLLFAALTKSGASLIGRRVNQCIGSGCDAMANSGVDDFMCSGCYSRKRARLSALVERAGRTFHIPEDLDKVH